MSDVVFIPNQVGAKMLFNGAEQIYNHLDILYNTVIFIIIALILYFIVIQSTKYIKLENFDLFIVFPLFIGWCILYYVDPYKISTKRPRESILVNILIFFSLLLMFIFKQQFYHAPVKIKLEQNRDAVINVLEAPSEIAPLIKKMYMCILTIFIIFIIILCIVWGFAAMPGLAKTFEYILLFLIIVGGGGISYLYFKKKYTKYSHKKLSIPEKIIFYLPCLLLQFVDEMKLQYDITTAPMWILLAVEVVCVSIYFLIPVLFNYLTSYDSKTLLRDPVYLNNKHTLGTFENLKQSSNMKGKYAYEYAISGWFYINPQSPATNESYSEYTTIFNYANKPIIQYNSMKNNIRIQTDVGKGNMKNIYISKDVIYQKWNNFVINYDGSNMDFFMNGELVGTVANVAPYLYYQEVDAGSVNGIHGGLCNIKYHSKILSKYMIENTYNILKTYNIPIL